MTISHPTQREHTDSTDHNRDDRVQLSELSSQTKETCIHFLVLVSNSKDEMRFFFSSEASESSCDCPQTDTTEESKQIALCNYYALNSQTAHLHAAIVFVSTDGWFRRGNHSQSPSLLQNAQTAAWKITQKNSCLCLRRYLHGEKSNRGWKPQGIKLRKYCFQAKSKGTSH